MRLPLYLVDAFADRAFAGNPAAICFLEFWLPEVTMQSIAAEMNLSETAFVVPTQEGWHIRWFTPTLEVDLVGHATLAAAFSSLSGSREAVPRSASRASADRSWSAAMAIFWRWIFRHSVPLPCAPPPGLVDGLGAAPVEMLAAQHYLAVFENEDAVRALSPRTDRLAALDRAAVIVTAPGRTAHSSDFVSRFFAPANGVPEDPVSGVAHCRLDSLSVAAARQAPACCPSALASRRLPNLRGSRRPRHRRAGRPCSSSKALSCWTLPECRRSSFPIAPPIWRNSWTKQLLLSFPSSSCASPSPRRMRCSRRFREATAIVHFQTRLTGPMLAACPHLRIIVFLGTGVSSWSIFPAAEHHGIVVETRARLCRPNSGRAYARPYSCRAGGSPRWTAKSRKGMWQADALFELYGRRSASSGSVGSAASLLGSGPPSDFE